jgi:hypothetical protein
MKQSIQIEVEKEVYEVGAAFVALCSAFAQAKADGKVELAEIVASLSLSLPTFIAAAEGISQLPAEAKDDVGCFVKSIAVQVADGVSVLLAKKV